MTFSSVCHSVFKSEHVISPGVISCPIRGPTSVLISAVHSRRCGESNGELEVLHKGKIDAVCILFPHHSQPYGGAGHLNSEAIHSVESESKFVS